MARYSNSAGYTKNAIVTRPKNGFNIVFLLLLFALLNTPGSGVIGWIVACSTNKQVAVVKDFTDVKFFDRIMCRSVNGGWTPGRAMGWVPEIPDQEVLDSAFSTVCYYRFRHANVDKIIHPKIIEKMEKNILDLPKLINLTVKKPLSGSHFVLVYFEQPDIGCCNDPVGFLTTDELSRL